MHLYVIACRELCNPVVDLSFAHALITVYIHGVEIFGGQELKMIERTFSLRVCLQRNHHLDRCYSRLSAYQRWHCLLTDVIDFCANSW